MTEQIKAKFKVGQSVRLRVLEDINKGKTYLNRQWMPEGHYERYKRDYGIRYIIVHVQHNNYRYQVHSRLLDREVPTIFFENDLEPDMRNY